MVDDVSKRAKGKKQQDSDVKNFEQVLTPRPDDDGFAAPAALYESNRLLRL